MPTKRNWIRTFVKGGGVATHKKPVANISPTATFLFQCIWSFLTWLSGSASIQKSMAMLKEACAMTAFSRSRQFIGWRLSQYSQTRLIGQHWNTKTKVVTRKETKVNAIVAQITRRMMRPEKMRI